ncbi:MAG TPA: ferredoxin family protein [Planctomycetota bacterium]|nr:ferredoxin family protein [Planctomycetota bacterium]
MPGPARVLYCGCAYAEIIPTDTKAQVIERLRAAGVDFEAVPDLCELAARRDPALRAIAGSGDVVVIACYPRAVRWLFAYAGAPLPETGVSILNLRAEEPQAIVTRVAGHYGVREVRNEPDAAHEPPGPSPKPGHWVPWFPVIDRSRCTGCQQCLNFCLFGVYALDAEGNVEVKNPANCKTNCPACARICPQVAIIFPKHKTSPINGDEVTAEHLAGREVRVDPKRLGRGDVYTALRRRSERARVAAAEPPVTEGDAAKLCPCMTEQLEKELGIPPEVLKTLSLPDIQAKLRAARGEK